MSTYERGLIEIADGVHAYLQPDGTWGWSNAGIIMGDSRSTLVDTLYDLHLTATMLSDMAPLTTTRPITTGVNTHANGDHCYGNQLVDGPGVDFIASETAAREIDEVPPSLLHALVQFGTEGDLGEFVEVAFAPFDYEGIEVPPTTTTFNGELELNSDGVRVDLLELGPAHTGGDVIAWLPEQRVLFAGDLLFHGGTPIMWSGPITNWIAACDVIAELRPETIVPGHGPLATLDGIRDIRDYLTLVYEMAAERQRQGMDARDASRDIDLAINGTRFSNWTDRERLVVTVHGVYRELDEHFVTPDVTELLEYMAADFVSRRNHTA